PHDDVPRYRLYRGACPHRVRRLHSDQVHPVGAPVTLATVHLLAETVQSKNPILPSGAELVWGIISFVLLFGILAKFAYPALAKSMQARTERIRTNVDEAQRVRDEAEQILRDYQAQLAD